MTGDVVVRVAEAEVGRPGRSLVTYGLGSCIAVILHDAGNQVGGMAHILLPSPSLARAGSNPYKFPQTAIPLLLEAMFDAGANPKAVTARLVGGASMFDNLVPGGTIQMGERNLVATRKTLAERGVPIVAEAVGGTVGRTVRFDIASGKVVVSSVREGAQEL